MSWRCAVTMSDVELSAYSLGGTARSSTENMESYSYRLMYRPGRSTRAKALAPVSVSTYFEVSLQAVLA